MIMIELTTPGEEKRWFNAEHFVSIFRRSESSATEIETHAEDYLVVETPFQIAVEIRTYLDSL